VSCFISSLSSFTIYGAVPFLSRLLPSDLCKIHKCGEKIRVDCTLMDFNEMSWQRGDLSFVFNGEDQNNGKAS